MMFGISQETLISLAAAASAVLAFGAIWSSLLERNPNQRRVKNLLARRDELSRNMGAPTRARSALMTQAGLTQSSLSKSLMRKLRGDNKSRMNDTKAKLAQAGWRSDVALNRFVLGKMLLPIVTFGLGWLIFINPDAERMERVNDLLMVAGAIVAGYIAPDILIKNQIDKRKQAIRKQLPDALDLMVICVQAGLTLDKALSRVVNEMQYASPEVTDELGYTGVELGFLPDRKIALAHLAERVDLPEIRSIVSSLVQTERYGTPVSRSLKVLAEQFRHERLMRAEEKAAKLPATMTVPMILFILPCLFIVLGGPAFIRIMDTLGNM